MIKQIVGGKSVASVYVEGTTADIEALQLLMEGKQEVYDLKFSAGTATTTPTKLNPIRFSTGKKLSKRTSLSCSVSVPHIKPTKSFSDLRPLVVGLFDCNYEVSTKSEYANLLGSKNEVA